MLIKLTGFSVAFIGSKALWNSWKKSEEKLLTWNMVLLKLCLAVMDHLCLSEQRARERHEWLDDVLECWQFCYLTIWWCFGRVGTLLLLVRQQIHFWCATMAPNWVQAVYTDFCLAQYWDLSRSTTKWPVCPVHPAWSVVAVRMKKTWVLSYPLSTQQRLIRLGTHLLLEHVSYIQKYSMTRKIWFWTTRNKDMLQKTWLLKNHFGDLEGMLPV